MEDDRFLDLHGPTTEEARSAHLASIALIGRLQDSWSRKETPLHHFTNKHMTINLLEELPEPTKMPCVVHDAMPQHPYVKPKTLGIVMVQQCLTAERSLRRQSVDGAVRRVSVANLDGCQDLRLKVGG